MSPFVFLAHVVGVSDRLAAREQGEAVERVHLDEAAHQLGRSVEVPVELLPPEGGFLLSSAPNSPGRTCQRSTRSGT